MKKICLIGSTKFESVFRTLEEEFSCKGAIVLSPLVYSQSGDSPKCGSDVKEILDFVQLEKVRMSDIVVVDKNGYIGDSTRKQETYAKLLEKLLYYYSKDDLNVL